MRMVYNEWTHHINQIYLCKVVRHRTDLSWLHIAYFYIETRLPYIEDSPSHQNRPNILSFHHKWTIYVYTIYFLSCSGIDLGHMSEELHTKKSCYFNFFFSK